MGEHSQITANNQTTANAAALSMPAEKNIDHNDNINLVFQRKLSVGAADDPMEDEADATADMVMRMPEQSFIQRKCDCEEKEEVQRKTLSPMQFKLSVGDVNDPMEEEADNMADKVMRMPDASFIQRKCAHCDEKEKEKLQRKPLASFIQKKSSDGTTSTSNAVAAGIESSRGKGSTLPASSQSFMENRFGADFSDVRIHDNSHAAALSNELHAQAFTVGRDIYFNEGKYSPASDDGKHLLAHELTHTIQQKSWIGRKIQRAGETGTSIYEDRLSGTSRDSGKPGIVEGDVERSEYNNEADRKAGKYIHRSLVGLRFDENECKIYVPHKVQFVNHSTGNPTSCGGKIDNVNPVSSTKLRQVANNFLKANNEGLNGWFLLRLTNAPKSRCNDRNIPIIIQVEEVTSNPDTTVVITGNKGRSYVSGDSQRSMAVLCDDPDEETLIHESGHMTLGHNDEYSNRDEGPAERERLTDYSRMAQSGPSRLQIFHERHFNFVSEFIRGVYPGSNVSLVFGEQSRLKPSFNFSFSLGGAAGDFSGIFYSAGLDLGIPLNYLRKTELLIGPRFGFIGGSAKNEQVIALLYGLRLSLSHSFDTKIFNRQVPIGLTGYAEYGGGHNFLDKGLSKDFSYAEYGASLGYHGNSFALGVSLGFGILDPNGKNSSSYDRIGIDFGARF